MEQIINAEITHGQLQAFSTVFVKIDHLDTSTQSLGSRRRSSLVLCAKQIPARAETSSNLADHAG